MASSNPRVLIIMGSDSDLGVMREAADVLQELNVPSEMTVVSAHRTPERMAQYAKEAQGRGIQVIVAGAGGAAHLPGMVASHTALPVIGVPIKTSAMDGVDSLLSIVQMPPGVPVATVAINGAKNAGILAAEILGSADERIASRIQAYKRDMADSVLEKAEKLERQGHEKYLKAMRNHGRTGSQGR